MKTYAYEDQSRNLINKEIDARVGALTAKGLIKSESEYKKTIQSLLDSINFDFGRITSATNYHVKADDVVSSASLNGLFSDIEADLRILHTELDNAQKVLDLSLNRNKLFYRRIKTKLAAMSKEISKFRESSYNTESADYVFFESFDAENSTMSLRELSIDKKLGIVHLTPQIIKTHNKSDNIREVGITIYPVENKDGGVYDTTNSSNKLTFNYTTGDRNMLKDGLWKTQLLTAKIPETPLDIFNRGTTVKYNGIVVYIDIHFTGRKFINELGIDPYGEFPLDVIGVRFKRSEGSSWENFSTLLDNGLRKNISGSGSDWIYFRNIDPTYCNSIRIMLFQENYNTLSKLLSKVDTMVDKIVRDLVERRYEKTEYSYKFFDEMPRVQNESIATSTLYDEVMNVIETENDVEVLEDKLGDLLVPEPDNIEQDISNWKLYNVGAWSIEPKMVSYSPNAVGTYISHDLKDRRSGFKLDNGSPTEVKLYTKQTEANSTFIEWSLLNEDGTIEIPIIPNNDRWRSESAAVAEYYPLKNLTHRTNTDLRNLNQVVKLDFPVHHGYISEIEIFENGNSVFSANADTVGQRGNMAELYNSTELYFSDIEFKKNKMYVIKYLPALIDIVQCWVLRPNIEQAQNLDDSNAFNLDVASAMVFANENLAKVVAEKISTFDFSTTNSFLTKSNSYTPVLALCTSVEYNQWFKNGEDGMFIDLVVNAASTSNYPGDQIVELLPDNVTANLDFTRMSWLYNPNFTQKPYSESSDAYTWAALPPAAPIIHNKEKHYAKWIK